MVTGAGPIGLLAALIGVQRGLEVHVIDQMTEGVKPDLVRQLGAHYHTGAIDDVCPDADVIMECTGVSSLVLDAMEHVGTGGVVCLTGVSSGGRTVEVDEGSLNRSMVLSNESVVGSVNANRRHYEAAAEALAKADRGWLGKVVSRRVPLARLAAGARPPARRREGGGGGRPGLSGPGAHPHPHPHPHRPGPTGRGGRVAGTADGGEPAAGPGPSPRGCSRSTPCSAGGSG